MVQWMNPQWDYKFIDPMLLYKLCEKFGGLYLVEPDLTVGLLAGRLAG